MNAFWRGLAAAALLTACGDGNNNGNNGNGNDGGTGNDGGETATASLRVVHAAPGAPAVDVYAQGNATPLVSNLSYTQTSTFVSVPAGSYTIEVRAAGAAPTSAAAYTVGPLTLGEDAVVTAVASGLLASSDEADAFRVLPLVHGFGADAAGSARAVIVHAGSDAPAVDIDVGNDGSAELEDVSRFANSGPEGVALPSGQALQVGIWANGARVTAFTTPALPDQSDLFLIATGLLADEPRDGTGFGILAVGPDGTVGLVRQNPVVYALHGAPDAPAVDIFAGTAELADDLGFGQLSGAIQVPPGTYTLDFFAHANGSDRPAGDPAASQGTPALEAGGEYLVIAGGFLSPEGEEPAFQLIAAAAGFEDAGTQARVRGVHASPDAPAVDVGTVTGDVLTALPGFTNLTFPGTTAAEGLAVDAGSLTLGVAAAGGTDPVATFGVTLTGGMEAFVVAAGALSPAEGEESFRLIAVDTAVTPWVAAEIAPE